MEKTLDNARKYEETGKEAYNPKDRPAFHLTPFIGWMNDPNGFSFYKGQYHLFYQYNPYSLYWDSMHWGHAVSKDLLHWGYLPAALAPENFYDSFGVFSGSSMELSDGRQLLMYTGVIKENDIDTQTQCLAIGNGTDYKKSEKNPVINTNQLPAGFDSSNFRDPKIWKDEQGYYNCIAVSKKTDGNGAVLLYRSKDAINWNFESVFLENDGSIGHMWECPDFFELDGKKIVCLSPQDMCAKEYKYHNGNGTVCFIGHLNKEGNKFIAESDNCIDYGIDFYAPQTIKNPDGRTIMIGWMQNWDSVNLTDRQNRNWFGQMSLPRELSVINGKLYQKPVKEIENFRQNPVIINNQKFNGSFSSDTLKGRCFDMEITIRPENKNDFNYFTVNLAGDERIEKKIILSYNAKKGLLTFDRSWSGTRRAICNISECKVQVCQELKLRIIMDKYSIEVFINDGQQVMTNTFYTDLSADKISFETQGSVIMNVEKYDLIF